MEGNQCSSSFCIIGQQDGEEGFNGSNDLRSALQRIVFTKMALRHPFEIGKYHLGQIGALFG